MNRPRPPHPMALMRARAALVVCDVQERLFHAMDADHREEVMRNIKALTTSARRLECATRRPRRYEP
jgi:isochorismate hydrolase